jgi:hypothetical protein
MSGRASNLDSGVALCRGSAFLPSAVSVACLISVHSGSFCHVLVTARPYILLLIDCSDCREKDMAQNMGKKRERRMTRKAYRGNIEKNNPILLVLSCFKAVMIFDVAQG